MLTYLFITDSLYSYLNSSFFLFSYTLFTMLALIIIFQIEFTSLFLHSINFALVFDIKLRNYLHFRYILLMGYVSASMVSFIHLLLSILRVKYEPSSTYTDINREKQTFSNLFLTSFG